MEEYGESKLGQRSAENIWQCQGRTQRLRRERLGDNCSVAFAYSRNIQEQQIKSILW